MGNPIMLVALVLYMELQLQAARVRYVTALVRLYVAYYRLLWAARGTRPWR